METTRYSANNERRALRAGQVVELYQQLTGTDAESVIRDLVCDLHHWLDFVQAQHEDAPVLDFDHEVNMGDYHYQCEISGDD